MIIKITPASGSKILSANEKEVIIKVDDYSDIVAWVASGKGQTLEDLRENPHYLKGKYLCVSNRGGLRLGE